MRILQLTRDFPPRSKGGISTAVGAMVRALSAAGVECAVLSFDGWRPRSRSGEAAEAIAEVRDGVRILRVSGPDHLDAARRFAREFGPAILHIHHAMLWDFTAEIRAELGAPIVKTVHTIQAEQNRLRGLDEETLSLSAQRKALAGADRLIAVSRVAANILLADDASIEPRLRVVPLALADEAADRAATTAERDQSILYAGRFADINGIAELFEAIPKILERVPSARFIIAGGMPDNKKSERRWRRRFEEACSASIRERVDFVGWLAEDELEKLYREALVLIAPSWFETFGLVVLEAMAHGCAIAATRAGGIAELIEDAVTGLLCKPRDVDALVDNTVRLLEEPELARRLGNAAAAETQSRHLWSNRLPELRAVYAELVG